MVTVMSVILDVDEVEKRRNELGLSKTELARRTGISAGRYTQLLGEAREGKKPFAPTVKELAAALRVRVKDIVIEAETVTRS